MKHEKECENIISKADAYHYLGSKDKHIVDLFDWIDQLNTLKDEVIESNMDSELEDELKKIITRLTYEIGFRMVGIFP